VFYICTLALVPRIQPPCVIVCKLLISINLSQPISVVCCIRNSPCEMTYCKQGDKLERAFDRGSPFELEAELAKDINRRTCARCSYRAPNDMNDDVLTADKRPVGA
jgi:hypothetical protein